MPLIHKECDFGMAKIPAHLRRNPQAVHMQKWRAYREIKGNPKAVLPVGKRLPLTFDRYKALILDYVKKAEKHGDKKAEYATKRFNELELSIEEAIAKNDITTAEKLAKELGGLPQDLGQHVSVSPGYRIAREIIADFKRTKGLRVFGFGVGYGQFLFFLKNFMGANVKGVDFGTFSRDFTRLKRLGVIHGTKADDYSLRRLGKFDVTYSIALFESDIIHKRREVLGMLDNLAAMTRKGGKSYHFILFENQVPVLRADIEARGFRIDTWKKLRAIHELKGKSTPLGEFNPFFIKLTKVTD